ncbi:MAG: TonB-dependent receptor [Ignavibacteriaceae bacterium]|jgi:iron complex outermembrane receptor protein
MIKILCAVLTLFSSLIFAATADGDSIKYVFDEVTVIEKSGKEDLNKIPSSINKVTIDESSSKNLLNTVKNIPGIFLQQRAGGATLTKITMRGFGARSNDPQIVGIKILIDGFPETEPDGRTALDQLDVSAFSQIEIGKTNSYNLFSAASGGYLNFISERNFPGTFSENRFTFGSFGFQKFQTEAGGKLKNGSVFVNLSNTKFDGWREHSANYSTNLNFYLKNQLDELSSLNLSVVGVSSVYKIAGALTASQLAADQSQANPNLVKRDERRSNKVLRVGLAYQKYFDEEQSISTLFYISPKTLMRSQKNSYRDFNRLHLGGKFQYNFVKKFAEDDVNKFSLGVDNQYQGGPSLFYSLSSTNERGTTLKQNKNEAGLNYGIYLHDEHTYKNLTFDFSLRYSNARYLMDDFVSPTLSDKMTFDAVTPGFGISYGLDEHNYLMVHYAKGVENPAFNEVDPPVELKPLRGLNPLLKPSTSHTIETGMKGNYSFDLDFINSFSYNIIGYTLWTYGELIPYQISNANYYVPAGKTKRYGLEAALSFTTQNFFAFTSSLTLAKNSFVEFSDDSSNFSGNKIPGIPERMLSLNLGYQNPQYPSINLQYTNLSKIYIDNANSVAAGSYDKFDLQLLYRISVQSVSINGFVEVENLFNKKYISSIAVNGSDGEFYEPGLPRNFTVGFAVNYQF